MSRASTGGRNASPCQAVIITTGTFLRAFDAHRRKETEGGRVGEAAARGLSGCLQKLGLELGRLKTGTPPRLDEGDDRFLAFEPQAGDESPMPFSYLNEYRCRVRVSVRASLDRSPPEFDTRIWRPPLPKSAATTTNPGFTTSSAPTCIAPRCTPARSNRPGPRYCPSIEDKVVRFADKEQHQIFLEPEGLDTDEIYCNGISTCCRPTCRSRSIRLVPGLENAEDSALRLRGRIRHGLADADPLDAGDQKIAGLFLAGQINGTSGYEEAAAQGLIAGINAARYSACGVADFVLRRDQAYIGVLIDDLVTKPPTEPYRMFTSRAEHRLHLRNDNADERLHPIGREIGLVDDSRWRSFQSRRDRNRRRHGDRCITRRIDGLLASDWLRRSENDWSKLCEEVSPQPLPSPADIARLLEIRMKYAGYIARQDKQIERFAKMENKLIPTSMDYEARHRPAQ